MTSLPRLLPRPSPLAILEEVSQVDPRAKKVKAQDLIDRRYLDELEKSGLFEQLWPSKR